jgi:hypothetical protein
LSSGRPRGKKLAIRVPRTKTEVLKHFQAATAELHAPMSDEGTMISLEKPEIRNVLKLGWTVVRGILELAIMLYVLAAILERLGEDPNIDREIANTDATMSRILLNAYIAGTFIALQYVVCLIYIFSSL